MLFRLQLVTLGLLLASSVARGAEQPNILFIFADDHCYKAINSLHNKEVQTPNLDRLVAQGTTFTHAYNMGSWSGAVCLASRAMLNTGRTVWRAEKATPNLKYHVEQGETWGQLMGAAGYDTYFTGKWHVKANAVDLFQNVKNVRPGMPNQTKEGYNRPIDGQPDPWDPADPKFEGFWKGGKHWSEVLADDGEEFLGVASKSDKPFFMYLAFNAPHDPRQAPQEYLDRYPVENISLPPGHCDKYQYAEEMKSGEGLRDEKLAPFPRTENSVKVNRREYYALINHMDTQIGRILTALDKTGKAENTYIFFSADHGLGVGHHGLMGKQNPFDHSTRVPFMVVGPDIEAGKKIGEPIYLQDVMATSLELGGVDKPDYVEFNSIQPLLDGGKSPYRAIYGAYLDAQRSVTHDSYKLILFPKVPVALLFDLNKDPDETNNLAENPENLPTMQKLFSELQTLQTDLGDTKVDLAELYPELL